MVAGDTVINRNERVLYSSLDDDNAVLLTDASDDYYGLNGVGARIWELLGDGGLSLSTLCARLCSEFEVDPETCETAVERFIRDSVDCGLMRASAP